MNLNPFAKRDELNAILATFQTAVSKLDVLVASGNEDISVAIADIAELNRSVNTKRSAVDRAIKVRANISALIEDTND